MITETSVIGSQSSSSTSTASSGRRVSHRTFVGIEKLRTGGRKVESFYNRYAPAVSAYTGVALPWYPGVVDRLTAPLTRFHE